MKNNRKFLPLYIQLFAEDKGESMEDTAEKVSNEQETTKEETEKADKSEKTFTRDEVNKMINAEKNKIRSELEKEAETKRKEAERVAKMDADEKSAYELQQSNKERDDYKAKYNALTIQIEANNYAGQKGVPLGYIEDWDFSNMTSDVAKEKIDKLATVRSNDLKGYLNKNLRQSDPKEHEGKEKEDPFIAGFKNYKNKYK